jgi:hypothetical protein
MEDSMVVQGLIPWDFRLKPAGTWGQGSAGKLAIGEGGGTDDESEEEGFTRAELEGGGGVGAIGQSRGSF